jgi:hypothetical protein
MGRTLAAALALCLLVPLSAPSGAAEEAQPASLELMDISVPPLKLKPPHLRLPPGSWVRVSVRVTLDGEGRVSAAEAAGAEVLGVHRGELVPSEMHGVEEEHAALLEAAAAAAVREARLLPREERGDGEGSGRSGRVDLVWRIPPKRSRGEVPPLEPAMICRTARRSGGLWTCPVEGSELVLLFLGPARAHELGEPAKGPAADERVASGLPQDPRALSEEIGVEILEEIPGEVLAPGKGVGVREAEVEAGRQGPPELPRELREDFAVEGDVDLDLVIDEKGTLAGIVVRRGVPGFPEIAEEACRWLAGAEYRAARYKGTAYTSSLRIRFPMRAAPPPLDVPEGG